MYGLDKLTAWEQRDARIGNSDKVTDATFCSVYFIYASKSNDSI